jgi:aryl-alcohol dehydrogenase
VEKVGSNVSTVKAGDKVLLSWAYCRTDCNACINGHPNICEKVWNLSAAIDGPRD